VCIQANRRHALVALVVLAALAAHATALVAGFAWLDHAHLVEGLALAPAEGWLALFARGFAGTGFYRPLTAVSLSVDAALGGAPWLYHAVTVAWHAAAAAMTLLAAEALGLSRRAAAAAAVIFAVHPVTSLVASAIAFRSESMIAVTLLALIVFHRRERPLGAAVALLGGALVKETALVLGPLVVGALELGYPAAGRRRARVLAAEAAALALALGLRLAFAPAWRATHVGLAPGEAVGTRLAALAKSARALLVAGDRTICDAFPVTPAVSLAALAGGLLAIGLGYLAWRRRGPALLLALSLLPALQLVPVMRWWSPHYLYVPLAFAAMLAAEGIERLGRRALPAALVVAGALALVTAWDDLRFRTDEILWSREVRIQPGCREGQFYLAEAAREARRWDEAALRYGRAAAPSAGLISYVDRGAALQNLGVVELERGRFGEAAGAFRAALAGAGDPLERRRLTHNLATAELRAGRPMEAARLLEPEARRPDAFAGSLLILARAMHELGRPEEAAALVARLRAARR
jgi:hypothetical protein